MLDGINLPVILGAAFVASASPGPATLAIAGTSMQQGRRYGLALAEGVMTGSLIWSIAASLGLGAIMLANVWAFELLRYLGAGYLLFLAFKSARSALKPAGAPASIALSSSLRRAYSKGLALHLTNPKAILFFGSLYAIAIPAGSSLVSLATVIAAVGLQSAIIFNGYALLFSHAGVTRGYVRLKRWFEGAFALAFGAAGIKVLLAGSASR